MTAEAMREELDQWCVCGHPKARHLNATGRCLWRRPYSDHEGPSFCKCSAFGGTLAAAVDRPPSARRATSEGDGG